MLTKEQIQKAEKLETKGWANCTIHKITSEELEADGIVYKTKDWYQGAREKHFWKEIGL